MLIGEYGDGRSGRLQSQWVNTQKLWYTPDVVGYYQLVRLLSMGVGEAILMT